MASQLTKAAYQKLIDEDIAAIIESNCSKLEKDHIIHVLRDSVGCYYSSNSTDKLQRLESRIFAIERRLAAEDEQRDHLRDSSW